MCGYVPAPVYGDFRVVGGIAGVNVDHELHGGLLGGLSKVGWDFLVPVVDAVDDFGVYFLGVPGHDFLHGVEVEFEYFGGVGYPVVLNNFFE